MVAEPPSLYAGPMSRESLLSTIAREAVVASGAGVEFQSTVLPPIGVDLAAMARGAPAPPPPAGGSPVAAFMGWLTRPTIVARGPGGVAKVYPLTQYGAAPQSTLAQLVLPVAAAAGVGLAGYGLFQVIQRLRGR